MTTHPIASGRALFALPGNSFTALACSGRRFTPRDLKMADDRFAPAGAIWVCGACGKTHKDRYGIEGEGARGWDESCMLNAVLCHDAKKFDAKGLLSWHAYKETAA